MIRCELVRDHETAMGMEKIWRRQDAVLCMMLLQRKQVGQDIFQDFKNLQRLRIGKLSAEHEHAVDIVCANLVASSIGFDTCETWVGARS